MVAGFLAAIDRGMDYTQALYFASSCGSATAASNGLAKRATIDKFYASLSKIMAEKTAAQVEEIEESGSDVDMSDVKEFDEIGTDK
jgi:1-phosphofructokinase